MNQELYRLQRDRNHAERSYYRTLRTYHPSQAEIRNSKNRLDKLNSQIEKIIGESEA